MRYFKLIFSSSTYKIEGKRRMHILKEDDKRDDNQKYERKIIYICIFFLKKWIIYKQTNKYLSEKSINRRQRKQRGKRNSTGRQAGNERKTRRKRRIGIKINMTTK